MSSRQRILWLLATITLLSCGRSHPVDRHPELITRALAAKPHRLAVLFWPQNAGCASCDQLISTVISEWETASHELAVVTVLPDHSRTNEPWLPGAIVRLKPEDYERHGAGPLPRVEIWSAEGTMLLSRSVPNYGSQAELLNEEMLAARSFTAPVKVASRTEALR